MPAGYPGSEDRDDRKKGNAKRNRQRFLRHMHDEAAKPRWLGGYVVRNGEFEPKMRRNEARAKFATEPPERRARDSYEVRQMLRFGISQPKPSKAIPASARKLRKIGGKG